MTMKIEDVMVTDVVTVNKELSVFEAAEMLKSKDIGCVIITENAKIAGIATERDIIHKVVAGSLDPKNTNLEQIMTKDVLTLGKDNLVREAVDLMEVKNIKKLPIVDEGKLIGIVTMTDLISILRKIEAAMLKIQI